MADNPEYDEDFDEEDEETLGEYVEQITTMTVTEHKTQSLQSGLPTRKVRKRAKVDTSKFMTPYLAHSMKMLEQFSHNKYRQAYEMSKGAPPAITTDTPELIRIRKAQEQLSEVKYRMEGNKVRTSSLYNGEAREIAHVKHVSELISKVLYRQKWDETKDKYLLPPDAPELVLAVKNAANYSKKLYTESWDEEKVLYYPYSDSPELRRVAKAQEVLSDICYKKGHDERKAKYSCLPDPPEVELARRVANQRSDLKYKEDYNKNVKGQWCETPYFDIAIARMAMDNLSDRKYTQHFENTKDQIYFMQTETPVYETQKKARIAASEVQYKKEYEKKKDQSDYNTLPATENPLLRQLRYAGTILSDKVYKASYEKSRGSSINYCDTPKFQMDSVLKKFTDIRYKEKYENEVKGHYVGSYEDLYMIHCQKMEEMKNEQLYKADYEDMKIRSYFPQTVTPEFEALRKLQKCNDKVYRQHPDTVKFTQVTDSPVLVQAQINAKQLSDLNYKAKYEKTKFKCSLPSDYPFFIQSRVNAFNLSDNCYKYDWEKTKAKKFEIKGDAISILAARAHTNIASDVKYKKEFEKNKGQMVGALSINDDPKILHSVHVAKIQSDREYKKNYEKIKTKYHTPLDMISVTTAKKSQAIASMAGYRSISTNFFLPHDSVLLDLAKKANSIQSDNEYKAEYNNYTKGSPWVPYGSLEVEKAKKAAEILNERKYRQHPDTIPFTSIDDHPIMLQARVNQLQRSDLFYKRGLQEVHQKYSLPPDIPEFIQAKCNAYNVSKNYYKLAWQELISKGYDLKPNAIPIVAAKAARHAVSDVQYKKAYEKARGHHVGFRSLQDDPLLVHYMEVARIQSDKLYKKDYEKAKLKYHTPVDMMSLAHAKHASKVQTFAGYKQHHHNYCLLPDSVGLELARNMSYNASDNNYKLEYETLIKGTGWVPIGSLDVEKAKTAGAALDERKYRQHPSMFKFTSVTDSMNMELAKANAKIMNAKEYKASGEKFMHTYHLPADAPEFLQARYNAVNVSQNYYTYSHRRDLLKGHHVKEDAIPIVAAKSTRDIASNYKYKLAFEKAKGHHVGIRSLQDDPLLVHYMEVAKMQSDKLYKKDYEKVKLKYHSPVDMVSLVHAKQASAAQTMAGYRNIPHSFMLLPDNLHLQRCRNMMEIQSDNVYKLDYNVNCKGIGWVPIGSIDVEKARTANAALNEIGYRQHPSTFKFTSKTDAMNMALALTNSKLMDKAAYKASGEKFMHTYNLPADSPEFLQAKFNAQSLSESYYKHKWLQDIAKGYDMKPDAISVLHAKQGRHIASNVQYKKEYEKARGHHVGFRSLQDDPLLVHYMEIAKMQSDKLYKKDYEKAKLKYHTPVDMLSVVHAKQASTAQTMIGYKQIPHNYMLLPDNMHLQLYRNMNFQSSDFNYKSEWNNYVRGIGWVPIGSISVETAKVGGDIQSEKKYRTHPSQFKFSKLMDSMDLTLATANNQIMNKKAYTSAWEKDKLKIHVMPDSPEIILAKANALNMSNKLYKAGVVEMANKGHNLKADAIPIVAAKTGTKIASDYKYKLDYEKAKGHHVGFRSLQDDPLLVHYMEVAKIQSEKIYKKDYEKAKLKYHTPVDMLSVVHAKQASAAQTMAGYRQIHHTNALLPDAMNLQLARVMNEQSSDWNYKAEWNNYIRGIGWIPIGSVGVETAKVGGQILSDHKYRTHPSNFTFRKLMDSMDIALATANNQIMNKKSYTEAWEKDKTKVHVMPDAPEIVLAKANAITMSNKLYKAGLVEMANKGYNLKPDAIAIQAAKSGTTIASNQASAAQTMIGYKKLITHYNVLPDAMNLELARNMQFIASDNQYKKEYDMYMKGIGWVPIGSLDVEKAKTAAKALNEQLYRQHPSTLKFTKDMHSMDLALATANNQIMNKKSYTQAWDSDKTSIHIMPDAMSVVLARENKKNYSEKLYKLDNELSKKKGHNVRADAIAIQAAKGSTVIASDAFYKEDQKMMQGLGWVPIGSLDVEKVKKAGEILSESKYRQHPSNFKFKLTTEDMPMALAKANAQNMNKSAYIQAWEKDKTTVHVMPDAMDVVLAKANKVIYSESKYKQAYEESKKKGYDLRNDAISVLAAKASRDIASDAVYKEELKMMQGIGWVPIGSLDVEKAKKAGEILSERQYRQHPSNFKFKVTTEDMPIVLAKANAKVMNKKSYVESWDNEKSNIHIMPDAMDCVLARANSYNYSLKKYKEENEEAKKKGYDMRNDAISIIAARASRDIASDAVYKEDLKMMQGIGWVPIGSLDVEKAKKAGEVLNERMYRQHPSNFKFKCTTEDMPLVLAKANAQVMNKKAYTEVWDKEKTKIHIMPDAMDVLLAKANNVNYSVKKYKQAHEDSKKKGYDLRGDAISVIAARASRDIASDAVYKADLKWLQGLGWVPIGSVDVEKAKKAAEILSEIKYRQHPSTVAFTSPTDAMNIVLAKNNALTMNKRLYTEAWEKDKVKLHIKPDTPEIILAQQNAVNTSKKLYRQGFEETIKKGYFLPPDSVSVKAAKGSRDIISDAVYKADLDEIVGVGWVPIGSLDVLKAKNAAKILNDRLYKQKPETLKFTTDMQSMPMVLAKTNADIMNKKNYIAAWEADKIKTHVTPDLPELLLSKANAYNISKKNYREDVEKIFRKGYDMKADAVSIIAAKHGRNIISDAVYKADMEWVKGMGWVPIGSVDVEKAKKAAEILSERKYRQHPSTFKFTAKTTDMPYALAQANAQVMNKKAYIAAWESDKTNLHIMPDTPEILLAQQNKLNTSLKYYREGFVNTINKGYNLPKDAVSVLAAKASRDIVSDAVYKADLEWLRGCGWSPHDCVDVVKVRHAQKVLNDRLYRQHPSTVKFTSVVDLPAIVLSKQNADNISDRKYREVWDKDKLTIHMPSNAPTFELAKANAVTISNKLYTKSWDDQKAMVYHIKEDAISVLKAKASRDIISDAVYKADMEWLRGCGWSPHECVDVMKAKNAQKILADRGYRVQLDRQPFMVPSDRMDIVRAKNAASVLNEVKYREAWHQDKINYSLVDTPVIATAREVAKNIHPKLYTDAWDKVKATGYFMPPDAVSIKQCISTSQVQSNVLYKADLEWIRGCGWVAADSVDHVKVKKAQEVLNDRLYKKHAKEEFGKFTLVVDRPEIVLAKINAANLSDLKYKESFNAEKGHYIGSDDTPQLAHSREVAKIISEKTYKMQWDESKATSYQLNHEFIPLLTGKKGREIASDAKYKDAHEKAKGHYIAGTLVDFPEVVRCGQQEKSKPLRVYQKDYHQSKTKNHIPSDIIANQVAKRCQDMLSNVLYRTYLHQWTCHPEQEDAIRARKTNEILSDVFYKDDLNWMKGIGCYVWDTPEIVRAKKSYELQSDLKYRADAKKEFNNYSIVTDTPEYVTAVLGHTWASELNYREAYHKEKHLYTAILDTYDYARCHNFKYFFSNKIYTSAWDKIKAKSYRIPHDSHALQHAKQQKVVLSNVKYKEDYEKFKSLYSLPKSLQDDPATARCVQVGKLVLDRLYKDNYEKTKAKNHIPPDMLEILSARNTQNTVSGINYRKYLHQWICMPDMQMYVQARKVNEQLSDIFYKDDMNWLKGIGCYAWDTPEILRVKHAGVLQSEAKYRAKGIEAFKEYTVVTDTPVYETAKQNAQNLSDLHYRYDYNANVKGSSSSPAVTIETERARMANHIQSDKWYKEANKNFMPTGYSLPSDTPLIKQAKINKVVTSSYKYKEAYEMMKAKAYTLHPEGVSFVNTRKVNKIINDRLYREAYEKQKDKIHLTYDTPDINQVKMNQRNLSDLRYKEKYYNSRGQLISMPMTPELIHCYHVNEITSDLKYKEDLVWLRGVGCFLYNTPEMIHVRNITKQRTNYPVEAKKNLANFTVVLDTPEYKRVTELKTHMSDLIYKADSKQEMAKVTSTADSLDIKRVKWAQQLSNKYQYTNLASKERAHFTPEKETPDMEHARRMKVVYSDNKYKDQYEKMKHRYTAIPDTPHLIRAKKAYLQSSDLRYKETFELSKGHYHTVKDALDIVCHRRVTDDISEVKYREKYISTLGTWKSIPDRPEFFFNRVVAENISNVKYKEDLEWLKGIGCFVWDTPELQQAERNKTLYSERLYKASFEKNRSNFRYTCDTPFFHAAKNASILINDKVYKSRAKDLLKGGCNELLRPDILTALCQSIMGSQWKYREQYERAKDKFTSVLETPMYETHKRSKKISDVIYRMEYNKTKAKAYTLPYDTPHQQHMKRVKEITSDLKYKEVYERSKAQINMDPEAHEIRAAKEAYKNISNLDYKKKYEETKNKWIWTTDRPDFINAAKNSLQQSDVEYKYDKEMMKGCVIPVTNDMYTLMYKKNAEMASDVKYKEKYEKTKGNYVPVLDTPQILHAKAVRSLVSESKYKAASKKVMQSGSFTTLRETRDTAHSKEVKKLVSEKQYKAKFEKEKGKSVYNHMIVPPDIQHAMEVAKNQSNVAYKKDAKASLHYTTVVDRPDIRKATQAAKLISEIGYREKAREEASRGGSLANRPDIALATHVSQLTSQVKYKEKFDKEVKGKKPQYDLKESKIYKTLKDANELASEVKYKGDLKKIHKPVTDMAESLSMQHSLSTSKLSSDYRYKKKFEESKGHYHMIPDTPEQLHLKEASELQSNVKYKEKYEKEKGKPMLDFETPTYVTAKEAQHMQSQKEYRKDLEEGVKGKGLTVLEETPELLRAKNATQILCEREYKKALEQEIKGKGMLALATDTPDFMRARNATEILSQTKYKQIAEMDRASYTTVIDTPDIIHAQQMRNIVSQKKYKEEAEKTMSHYVPVLDTPEMQRVRENQRNFSTLQYQTDLKNIKGKVSTVKDTPEMLRVKENTKNFSSIKYKDSLGRGTAIPDLPEVKRVKETQRHISSVFYKDSSAKGTPVVFTPEMERVKRNQENISSVLYSDSFRKQVQGKAAFVLDTPEMRRVRETQRIISGVKYHEDFEKSKGSFTPTTSDPVTERVKRTTQEFSDISYRGIQRRVVEMERRRAIEHDQETITDLRVWRTNPGSVFDYDPAEDNIQSRSLHMMSVQAQRRSKEHSRSTSALSGMADEKSEVSQDPEHHLSLYSNGFMTSSIGYQQTKTVEVQQRSSSVATQQTTVSSIPSHPSTTGKTVRAMYDYTAADSDEVSFKDGDVIVNVQSIDEGWMYGTVQRTGKTGMLPANYVEAI
ncbi:Nebulin [Oryzias melastigma]|uniref:Nebulin n=1 Tax=Oryzias melastigma TaxID=30732 RepID=A0A834CJE7_ORYME|nr:Nebulin [Oryzias melastigma]